MALTGLELSIAEMCSLLIIDEDELSSTESNYSREKITQILREIGYPCSCHTAIKNIQYLTQNSDDKKKELLGVLKKILFTPETHSRSVPEDLTMKDLHRILFEYWGINNIQIHGDNKKIVDGRENAGRSGIEHIPISMPQPTPQFVIGRRRNNIEINRPRIENNPSFQIKHNGDLLEIILEVDRLTPCYKHYNG